MLMQSCSICGKRLELNQDNFPAPPTTGRYLPYCFHCLEKNNTNSPLLATRRKPDTQIRKPVPKPSPANEDGWISRSIHLVPLSEEEEARLKRLRESSKPILSYDELCSLGICLSCEAPLTGAEVIKGFCAECNKPGESGFNRSFEYAPRIKELTRDASREVWGVIIPRWFDEAEEKLKYLRSLTASQAFKLPSLPPRKRREHEMPSLTPPTPPSTSGRRGRIPGIRKLYKYCTVGMICKGLPLPATAEYFYMSGNQPRPECRACFLLLKEARRYQRDPDFFIWKLRKVLFEPVVDLVSVLNARIAQLKRDEKIAERLKRKQDEQALVNQGLKKCPKCTDPIPATTDNFHRNRTEPDGLNSYCKTHRGEISARWYRRLQAKRKPPPS